MDMSFLIYFAIILALTFLLRYLRKNNRIMSIRLLGIASCIVLIGYTVYKGQSLIFALIMALAILALSNNFDWLRRKKAEQD